MTTNQELTKIINHIKDADKIALFHHIMIDGDSLSCSYGLMQALKSKFPKKEIKWVAEKEGLKERFRGMKIDFKDIIEKIDDSYLAIIGDCASKARIHNFEEYQKAGKKVAFDHHRNDIDFEVDAFWHEPTWIASALQATTIVQQLDVNMDENIALNLLYGIITDSGRFAFSGADPMPLEFASQLMKSINSETIFNLYRAMNNKSFKEIKFESWVYKNMKLEDKLGYVKITQKDLDALNMVSNQAARVNLIANIEDEEVWMFFIQYPDFIRVEFRSHGIAVNEIAKHFGGGGHIRAAGCRLQTWEEVDKLIAYAKDFIKNNK